MDTPVKVIAMGPQTRAEEWALRQGMDIAERHIKGDPLETFKVRADLAAEIGEALTNVRRNCHLGIL